jgi:hypothetical protein
MKKLILMTAVMLLALDSQGTDHMDKRPATFPTGIRGETPDDIRG